MRKVIGIQEVVECNKKLKEQDLLFQIHLRDACGKQSLWIEPLDTTTCEEQKESMYVSMESYFLEKGYVITYSEDKMDFWIEG